MDDAALVYNFWRIRRTILQMCRDRGYLVSQEELEQTLEDFTDTYGDKPSEGKPKRSHLNVMVAFADDPTNILTAMFSDEEKLGLKDMKEYCKRMTDEGVSHTIIVVRKGLTPSARDLLVNFIDSSKLQLQVFLEDELLVNITKHDLVPKHIVLTEEEKKELLQRYRVKESQLPRIQSGDPVARYYGLVRGQIVRIVRRSETAGCYITYRLVT